MPAMPQVTQNSSWLLAYPSKVTSIFSALSQRVLLPRILHRSADRAVEANQLHLRPGTVARWPVWTLHSAEQHWSHDVAQGVDGSDWRTGQ